MLTSGRTSGEGRRGVGGPELSLNFHNNRDNDIDHTHLSITTT